MLFAVAELLIIIVTMSMDYVMLIELGNALQRTVLRNTVGSI